MNLKIGMVAVSGPKNELEQEMIKEIKKIPLFSKVSRTMVRSSSDVWRMIKAFV